MDHVQTILDVVPVTHDTTSIRLERPSGFVFTPGQATEVALDRDGWRDETRPFTFTSQPEEPILEFTIKSYPEHDGVTARVPELKPGDRLRIGEPWGAISDEGPGTFIAGGAGITPFIPILRRRAIAGDLDGCTLIYANKTPRDIILRDEWEAMAGLRTEFVVEEGAGDDECRGRLDVGLLDRLMPGASGTVYLCGPPPMMDTVREALSDLGTRDERIVTEDLG